MSEPRHIASPEADDIREDIALNEGLLASLADADDSESEESRTLIQRTLRTLRKRLQSVDGSEQTTQHDTGGAMSSNHSRHPPPFNVLRHHDHERSSTSRPAWSLRGDSFGRSSYLMPPPKFDLASRKRQRDNFEHDESLRESKSLRATPSPAGTRVPSPVPSTDSLDSFDFDDPVMQSLLDGYSRQEQRGDREYLKTLERKRKQEEEDAELARLLSTEWDQAEPLQPSQNHTAASTNSYTQAYLRSDGSLSRPAPPPVTSSASSSQSSHNVFRADYGFDDIKAEPRRSWEHNLAFSDPSTPISSPDDSIEEISANEFVPRQQFTQHQPSLSQPTFSQPSFPPQSFSRPSFPVTLYASSSTMPGAFPGMLPYSSGTGGTSVYQTTPYNNLHSALGPATSVYGGVPFRPSPFDTALPGSARAPFDLEAYDSWRDGLFDSVRDSYADPAKTREQIKELLQHIRPDEELTPEQRAQMPDGIKVRLMPHQLAGLTWMKKMEAGSNKGGILADDMGLGKTIQSIALILANPPRDGPRPTLIVAPVALIQQWKRELEKKVRLSHSLNIMVLHGEARRTSWSVLRRFDVVLTTYGLLASELKRKLAWEEKLKSIPDARPAPHEECPILGDRSKFHRVILDEAQWIKNRNTKAALAACRIQSDYRWALTGTPMQNNVDEMFSLIKFCRIKPYNDWNKFARDFSRPLRARYEASKDKAMQQLQALLRAILLRRTKTSQIDGKPIIQLPPKRTVQDRAVFDRDELDFYRGLEDRAKIEFNKFLRNGRIGQNYSHALVLILRLRQCCCHPQLVAQSMDFIQTGTLDPAELISNAKALANDVVARLKQLDAFECPICMDVNENPALPPCGHALCNDCLSKLVDQALNSEEDAHASCPHCRAKIDSTKMTDLVSFLKVHCPERAGVEPLDDVDRNGDSDLDDDEDDDDNEDEVMAKKDGGSSGHYYHKYDEEDYHRPTKANAGSSQGKGKASRDQAKSARKGKQTMKGKSLADLRKEGLRNKAARRKYLDQLEKDYKPSAKITKTIELLQQIRDRALNEKTIIFSSFTSFLDLLEVELRRHPDFNNYARYDGSMKPSDRNDAVLTFVDNPHCKVILVSIKAGNAGLNLTAANHVIILDPFWNPFVEHQAADRCHRIGQYREVTIHRILIGREGAEENHLPPEDEAEFTIEDRILRLQEKKQQLIDTALDESAGQNIARLGVRELGYLFGVNSLD